MRAGDLAEEFPIVDVDADALQAVQGLARGRLPGLIVCTGDRRPYTILPGSQVLRFVIPTYIQDDPALARALDEAASDDLIGKLRRATVRDLLPRPTDLEDLPVVDADATPLEVAAVMARMHSPLVAVVGADGRVLGAVSVSRLLEPLLPDVPLT